MADAERIWRVAHRAGNDPTCFGPAIAAGADLLEADVFTWHGRLELRHGRRLGALPWLYEEPFTVRRRDERLLADVATGLTSGTRLMLDLKGWQPWLGPGARAVMERVAPGADYTVCGRSWRALDAFADLDRVQVVHSVGSQRELARLPARLRYRRTWGIAIQRTLLTPGRVRELRSMAEVVMAWPVEGPQAYEQVVSLGVNGVISDDLAALPGARPDTRPRDPAPPP